MNEEYLVSVFKKALVAARAEEERSLGLSILWSDAARTLKGVEQVERFDTLLRSDGWLRDFAEAVLKKRLLQNLGVKKP